MKLHSRTEKVTFFPVRNLLQTMDVNWAHCNRMAIHPCAKCIEYVLGFFNWFSYSVNDNHHKLHVLRSKANRKTPSLVQRFLREQRHWPEVHVGSAAFCVT